VEFLVTIKVHLPGDMADGDHKALVAAEADRGRELVKAGKIRYIWRLPGGLRNVGVWNVADATELHDLIASLPMYRWCEVEVASLARHPLQDSFGEQ
jgi:muconolactone D-isomerase